MLRTSTRTCCEAQVFSKPTPQPRQFTVSALTQECRWLVPTDRLPLPQFTSTTLTSAEVRPLLTRWRNRTTKLPAQYSRSFSTASRCRVWRNFVPDSAKPPVTHSFAFEPMNIPEETEADKEQLLTRRIHILGLGSIGTFVAHSLQCLPNPPPISLIMHKPDMYTTFKEKGQIIRLLRSGGETNDEQTGYDLDVMLPGEKTGTPYSEYRPWLNHDGEPANPLQPGELLDSGEVLIHTLIVAVKCPRTEFSLRNIKHRINSQTTICLLQNGMGQVEELNRWVFTDPATRPTYMLGVVSHGAHMSGRYAVVHAGFGTIALGIYRDTDKYPLPPSPAKLDVTELSDDARAIMYPTEKQLYSNLSSRYLLRTLTRSSILACAPFPCLDLVQLQLEKLATNCVINPVTALLNIPNGLMLNNNSISRAQRLLLAEISLVIRGLPELQGVPGVNARFSADRLESLCTALAAKTAENSSSMREDLRKHKPTEIDFINGYIVRRGEEQGVKCVLNYLITKLVHAKTEGVTEEVEVKPHGTTSIESDVSSLIAANPGDPIILEDKGTALKDKSY